MSEKRFTDVQPKYMSMMGELYGRLAGYIPFYSDRGFFGFITTDVYKLTFNDYEPVEKDCVDCLFMATLDEDSTPTEQVAEAFIEFVANIDSDQTPEQKEQMVIGFLTEHVMAAETVVSNVIKQMNATNLALPPESRIILPPKKIEKTVVDIHSKEVK